MAPPGLVLAALALALSPRPAQEPAQPAPRPLTLQEALELALQNHLGLEQQEIAADVARFRYAGSWGAFDPVATATASFDDNEFVGQSTLAGAPVVEENTLGLDTSLLFPLTSGGSFEFLFNTQNTETNNSFAIVDPSTTDVLRLSFRQPLWRGHGREYATSQQRESELLWRKELELLRQSRHDVLGRVEDAYWELVAAFAQLEVAQTSLALAREQLDRNQRRLDAGVGTAVEVLQAETTVARRIEEHLARDVAVREAADTLKGMIRPGTDVALWAEEIQPTTPLPQVSVDAVPTWQAAIVVALAQRPELRHQRLEIERGDLLLARAREEVDPTLDLELTTSATGFDGKSADAFESALKWEFPSHRAALTFRYPLLNRSASNARLAARAVLRSARVRYQELESQVVSETRVGVRQVLYQAEAVRAAAKSAELAERQLAAEEARYREGLSTNFQVLEFQQQLAEARHSEKRAIADFAKARTALLKAQGLLGEVLP